MKKLVILSILGLLFAFGSCSKSSDNPSHTVKYTVSSGSNMNVSYTKQDGSLVNANNVDANWTYSFTTTAKGQVVTLHVLNVNSSAVAVSGAIFIDGQQASQNNSATGDVTITAQIP